MEDNCRSSIALPGNAWCRNDFNCVTCSTSHLRECDLFNCTPLSLLLLFWKVKATMVMVRVNYLFSLWQNDYHNKVMFNTMIGVSMLLVDFVVVRFLKMSKNQALTICCEPRDYYFLFMDSSFSKEKLKLILRETNMCTGACIVSKRSTRKHQRMHKIYASPYYYSWYFWRRVAVLTLAAF